MHGNRHQIAHVDVPGAGDDLDRLRLAHIDLADPHVVAVLVAGHFKHAAYQHVGNLSAQIVGDLHLGAGQSHGLSKFLIIGLNGDELAEPLTR